MQFIPGGSTIIVRRGAALAAVALAALCGACGSDNGPTNSPPDPVLVAQGKDIFRFDTFGDETFWTDTLHMNLVIMSAVDPTTALAVGLKVDTDSLPPAVVAGIQSGAISLTSPATTVALLKLNAVIGLKGTVVSAGDHDSLVRVGITCALCHSTVDNSFALRESASGSTDGRTTTSIPARSSRSRAR